MRKIRIRTRHPISSTEHLPAIPDSALSVPGSALPEWRGEAVAPGVATTYVRVLTRRPRLAPEDLHTLQDHLPALAGALPPVRQEAAGELRKPQELPAALRQRVRSQLMPGEAALWMDRPTPRQYL